jgi:hypothetical protein
MRKEYIQLKNSNDEYVGWSTKPTKKALNEMLKQIGMTAEQVTVYYYFNQRKSQGVVVGDCTRMNGVEFLEKF